MEPNTPYQPPFPPPGPPTADGEPVTSGKALASLILALLSPIGCLLTAIPSLILGIIALSQIQSSGGRIKGTGLATAGLIISGVGILLIPVVVIVVAMVIPAVSIPAVSAARNAAQRAHSMNQIRQLELGLLYYQEKHGTYPAARSASGLSWRVYLLPMLEEQALFSEFHLDEPWDSPHNRALVDRMPEIYNSLGLDLPPGKTSYCLITGPGTLYVQPTNEPNTAMFIDGTTRSANLVQVDPSQAVIWTKPDDWSFDPAAPTQGLYLWDRRSTKEFLVGMADARVVPLDADTDDEEVRGMFQVNDGK